MWARLCESVCYPNISGGLSWQACLCDTCAVLIKDWPNTRGCMKSHSYHYCLLPLICLIMTAWEQRHLAEQMNWSKSTYCLNKICYAGTPAQNVWIHSMVYINQESVFLFWQILGDPFWRFHRLDGVSCIQCQLLLWKHLRLKVGYVPSELEQSVALQHWN